MAKVIESLKRLNVENGTRKYNDNRLVKRKSELVSSFEESVSSNYILAVCGTQSDPEYKIGTALAGGTCVIYSVGESLSRTLTLNKNRTTIVGIKFSPTSRNIFYTATSNGQITVSDLRAKGKQVAEFNDTTVDGKTRPLASFDLSCNERLIAGGTEHVGGDAFILFWDIRQSNSKINEKGCPLGAYWQSHVEDVTSLAFHSNKQDVLASGSTDGLINIFDLTQRSEDSALTYSLNTECSVDRLGWLNNDSLWCTTHMHSLQLWNCEDATPYAKFDRSDLVVTQSDDPDDCYVVRFHGSNALDQPFLVAGCINVKEDNLRCLSIVNGRLEKSHDIVGNRQLVRDSWLHEKSGSLVTVGENSCINIWRKAEVPSMEQNSGHKLVAKIGTGRGRDGQHRAKPY